jgi:hypothetical protein
MAETVKKIQSGVSRLMRRLSCGWHLRANHWRTVARSLLAIAVINPLSGRVSKDEKRVMKCSNPNCSHDIGLVSYQRGLFNKRRFCSKKCRDDFKVERSNPRQQERRVADGWAYSCHCGER